MTDWKIAAGVALLVLVSAGAAQGRICELFAEAPRVRAEGTAELAGEIVVACPAGRASGEIENFKAVVALQDGAAAANGHDGGADKIALEAVLTVLHDGAAVREAAGRVVDGRLEFTLTKPAAGAATDVEMKIAGVRVNAAAGGGGSVRASLGWPLPLRGGRTVVIARPTAGLRVEIPGVPAAGAQCAANEDGLAAGIRLQEGFAAAFTARGAAAQNIRLLLRFADIPAGVGVRLPAAPECADASLELALQSGLDSRGAGAGSAAAAAADGRVGVPLTSGSGFAVYEVAGSDERAVESCAIPLTFFWGGAGGGGRPEIGRGRVSADFAPMQAAAAAHAAAPAPRFVSTGEQSEILAVEPCSTTLLFPFVTNRTGFDTAIVIANTSRDAFGTEPQAGSCTIDYYGGTIGGAPPAPRTSAPVAAGGQLIFSLSAGSADHAVAAAPEFQGYVMARCDFQYAHGIALLSDGVGGAPSVLRGYMPLVVPHLPGQPREAPAGGLGH